MKYRLLLDGDEIHEGCEALMEDAEAWMVAGSMCWGRKYNSKEFTPMRKPVKPKTKPRKK